eukprot:11199520-Lingulodinium_polyedra.AAC.1
MGSHRTRTRNARAKAWAKVCKWRRRCARRGGRPRAPGAPRSTGKGGHGAGTVQPCPSGSKRPGASRGRPSWPGMPCAGH